MVLRQKREQSDILFIDASKHYIKEGKSNKLRSSDIKRIVDTVIARPNHIDKYARLVSKDEIRKNGYNLNIPRYVDSSENEQLYDMYSSIFGGIPNSEIDILDNYWSELPTLRNDLFKKINENNSSLVSENIQDTISTNKDVQNFIKNHEDKFKDFATFLHNKLIDDVLTLNLYKTQNEIVEYIFSKLDKDKLLDKYEAYQKLSDQFTSISTDIEMIKTEGFSCIKQVDPKMVLKKTKDSKESKEVQEGWIGHIIPFELVQENFFKDDYISIDNKKNRLSDISSSLDDIINSIDEEDREYFISEDGTSFVTKELTSKISEIYKDISTSETKTLEEYITLLDKKIKKNEKINFIQSHNDINWSAIEGEKPYTKTAINNYIKSLQKNYIFDDDTLESKLIKANSLLNEEKVIKKEIKNLEEDLCASTIDFIQNLDDEKAYDLLHLKWISPLVKDILHMPKNVILSLEQSIQSLIDKYEITYLDIENNIKESEQHISNMIDDLISDNEFDMEAMKIFKSLFKN